MAISLNASPQGLTIADAARQKKGWTKASPICCDKAHTSIATLKRFWSGSPIRREAFISICQALDLDWEKIAFHEEHIVESLPDDDLDALVQEVNSKIVFGFEFGKKNPKQQQTLQWIQENFLELDLVKVESLPAEYPVGDRDSLFKEQPPSEDSFDRLGISLLQGEKTSSRRVLEEDLNLFIYGEPGSGKSTFLRWTALQCRAGNLLSSYIPVFIEIRRLAAAGSNNTLLNIIEYMFEQWDIASEQLELLRDSGRILFIFDGFDEAPSHEWSRINSATEDVLREYENCRFIFSSRLASNFPFFEDFQKIIIAPFKGKKHIFKFINQWFRQPNKKAEMADSMIEKLQSPEYRGIRELTQRPILLQMLCVIFEAEASFPTKRADVFRMGIKEMLDSDHAVETGIDQIKVLEKHHIENILRRIAEHFFIDLDIQILFRTIDLERIVLDYISELFDINKALIPAEDILNAIEKSTGLIIRCAQNFWAFSHLTYQEFFVADSLVREDSYTNVYPYIREPRWNLVIELVAELMPQNLAFDFLRGIKKNIDRNIGGDKKIANYLSSVNSAADQILESIKLQDPYTKIYARSWYFSSAIKNAGEITNAGLVSKEFNFPDFSFVTLNIYSQEIEGHHLIYKVYHALSQEAYSGSFYNAINNVHKFFDSKKHEDIQYLRSNESINGWLRLIKSETEKFSNKDEWWTEKKESWRKRVAALLDSLNIPSTFELTDSQKEELRGYYDSTKLFSNCVCRAELIPQERQQLIDCMLVLEKWPPEDVGGFDRDSIAR